MNGIEADGFRIKLPLRGAAIEAAANAAEARAEKVERPGDALSLSGDLGLEEGTTLVLERLRKANVDPARLDPLEVRGLGGLVGRGIITSGQLTDLAEAIASEPTALAQALAKHRQTFMDRVEDLHGVALADSSSRWTVQEIANVDWVLAQLPESFKQIVREGPPLEREKASSAYSGLYDPFSNEIRFPDNLNHGGRTLAQVQNSERVMRSTMVHEFAHAWQIRQTSLLNPGVGNVLKGLRGIFLREHDAISEWSALSGWTIQSKWAIRDWFSKPHLPNASNASHQLAQLEFETFGRNLRFNLTSLKLDPAKERTMISDYAKTDPYEDFAESVSAYVIDPGTLKDRAPEKYAFINEQVMSGREYEYRYQLF